MAITNENYDNIFYKMRFFCLSYFLIKESDYILSDVKWSGGAESLHWGVWEELVSFFEEDGEG